MVGRRHNEVVFIPMDESIKISNATLPLSSFPASRSVAGDWLALLVWGVAGACAVGLVRVGQGVA